MDDDVVVVTGPKKMPKPKKLYRCTKCSYQTNRAYNVQRHLANHYEKPPRELQHLCPFSGCSFSSLRWDNLTRHIQRLHRVEKPAVKDSTTPPPTCEDSEIKPCDEEPASPKPTDEDRTYMDDEDRVYPEDEDQTYLEHVDQTYPEDEHQAYPEDEHQTYPEDEHKVYPEDGHQTHPEDGHQTYPEDEHQVYEEDDDQAYAEDEDQAYPGVEHEDDYEDTRSMTIDEMSTALSAEASSAAKPIQKEKDSKTQKKNIAKPKRSHMQGKIILYKCNSCDYRTNRGYNIKRHIVKHVPTEGVLLHVCIISGCKFVTPRWDNLCRHVKRVHPESASPAPD
ncbi:transcription elongation factor spt5 [Drosophila grimshawi]|uniref:GH13209 n=1 Tax=Drosophila grimshawi TaxID=7222 RepID=B4JQE2_DROGR|nr:transcription elongation factor spt5 [Drosophila grimshawi]EDV99122.1 GH13209 [Drosophila grimshawi]